MGHMLTIHAGAGGEAVVVDGEKIALVGHLEALREEHPTARVRQWAGTIFPGQTHQGPLPDAPTARERVHALLRRGVTAVVGDVPDDPVLRAALDRSGLQRFPCEPIAPGGRADLAVFDADGTCVATVLAGRLVHRRA
jgi:hypothetical protein